MTETAELVDLDVDVDLPVPCMAIDGDTGAPLDCPEPAVWVRIYWCCGFRRTYCEPHREEIYLTGPMYTWIQCAVCKTVANTDGEGTWFKL